MADYALQQQSQESQGLQYVDRYFGKKRTSNFVCLYRPVKHVPISYQSYCLNSQELMKQQIQLKKMQRRFQKFKKLLKVINDRVGLDTSYFFDDQEDSLLGEQTQANFDTKSLVSTKIKREDALRKRNQIVQRYYEALRSGINISRFCEINNLAQRTLRRWLNKK